MGFVFLFTGRRGGAFYRVFLWGMVQLTLCRHTQHQYCDHRNGCQHHNDDIPFIIHICFDLSIYFQLGQASEFPRVAVQSENPVIYPRRQLAAGDLLKNR